MCQRPKVQGKAPEGALAPLLLRPRDAAALLAVSERTVWQLLRAGVLSPIRPPGMRAVRIARTDVDALVDRWRASGAGSAEPEKSSLPGPQGSR